MKRILSLLSIMTLTVGTLSAGSNFYDEVFDRPTYFPDFRHPVAYPNNMNVLVSVVSPKGTRIPNYEIAVYDQEDKLRSTCRSISADGQLCLLTILGMEGDVFRFEVLYGDFENPQIRRIEGYTVPFLTNDIIGSPKNPVLFQIPVEPKVNYWLNDPSAEPIVANASEITNATLKNAVRVELKDYWGDNSIAELLDGCSSLQCIDIETMPGNIEGALEGLNPNCMIILPDDQKEVPAGWQNCVSEGKALTDIHLEDGTPSQPRPFFCPIDIDLDGHTAIYRRTGGWLYADGKSGWNTVVLPFDAQVLAGETVVPALESLSPSDEEWKQGAGYWAFSFGGGNAEELRFQLHRDGLEAHVPYLFTMPGRNFVKNIDEIDYTLNMEDQSITFVNASDVLKASTGCVPTVGEGAACDFVGTYQVMLSQPMSLLKSAITPEGYDAFVYLNRANLLPFRAFIMDVDPLEAAQMRTIQFSTEEETHIEQMPVVQSQSDAFDLLGRSVSNTDYRGFTIINHKMVVRK